MQCKQLTATTTHELFKPLIAPSLVAVVNPDCTISRSRCEISDDVIVLIWDVYGHERYERSYNNTINNSFLF